MLRPRGHSAPRASSSRIPIHLVVEDWRTARTTPMTPRLLGARRAFATLARPEVTGMSSGSKRSSSGCWWVSVSTDGRRTHARHSSVCQSSASACALVRRGSRGQLCWMPRQIAATDASHHRFSCIYIRSCRPRGLAIAPLRLHERRVLGSDAARGDSRSGIPRGRSTAAVRSGSPRFLAEDLGRSVQLPSCSGRAG